MTQPDFTSHRLFVDYPLGAGLPVALDRDQTNYLINVLRLAIGTSILVFNGRDGEWRARIIEANKRNCLIEAQERIREQTSLSDIWYCFAPLKSARLDYVVQKAVEMGAGRIIPVLTRHTQVNRLNIERLRANAIEAAEQCGILSVPPVDEDVKLTTLLARWEEQRTLIFCDEAAGTADPVAALRDVAPGPMAVLIGPEGGFSQEERANLLQLPQVARLSLGPRILRADTAGVAAMALAQAVLGDWKAPA
jgi:16S rRNA (uracil1498-N3)-methyltransferase